MPFAVQQLREPELLPCLNVDRRRIGDGIVGRDRALAIWRRLIHSPSFVGVMVKATSAAFQRDIVGFGCAVFVQSKFIQGELSNPQPGLNDRLLARINSGESVVLSDAQVRSCNSQGTLSLVVLYSNWCESLEFSEEQLFEIQNLLSLRFYEAYCGYRFDILIFEEIGKALRAFREATRVWRLVREFPEDRGLVFLTRENTLAYPASIGASLFLPRVPTLGLRREDQELLLAATDGATDQDVAKKLKLSVATVKKRWRSAWERVTITRPDLLPEISNSRALTRGPQRRHILLAYVREHPEELRPYESTKENRALTRLHESVSKLTTRNGDTSF